MAFPRTPQTWTDLPSTTTPYTAARMTDIETAIQLAGVYGVGSSPPGSPVDGMLWRFSPATGVYWLFQYDSSLATYKWAFVGGSAWVAEVGTLETTGSTSYVDLTTAGPSLTLTRAGIYVVEFGCQSANNTANSGFAVTPKIGAAASSDTDDASGTSATANSFMTMARSRPKTFAASDVCKLQFRAGTSGTASFLNRWLKITPQQVI